MKRLRRRNLKRKIKKLSHKPTGTYNDLNPPPPLPPHILDQIPAGATLRPNLASMRQMLAQRMAPNVVSLPFNLTPQQQQVQNMRTNNDLKENAINQAKQDMINENERKRSLQKQEADAKRENLLLKHSLENDRQKFEQQQQIEKEKHKLGIETKDLKFKQLLMTNENAIRQQKIRNETQSALLEQARHNNEKLKHTIEENDLNNRFKQQKAELQNITIENAALTEAIKKFDTETFMSEYTSLIENISHARARQRVLTALKDAQNKAIEEQILRMSDPTVEQIQQQFEQESHGIEGAQAALAKQIKLKQDAQEQMDRLVNLRKYKQKLAIQTGDLYNETKELNEQTELMAPDVNDEALKTIIHEKVDAEVNRDLANERVDSLQKHHNALIEKFMAEEKANIMNSEEYKQKQTDLSTLKVANERLKMNSQLLQESLAAQDATNKALFETETRQIALDARINGINPVDALMQKYNDQQLSPSKSAVLHQQMASQGQLINQESSEHGDIVTHIRQLLESPGTNGDKVRAIIEQHYDGDAEAFIGALTSSNLAAVKDMQNTLMHASNE